MRIAFIVGSFPLVSETFILRQITGLIDLGHEVDVYAAQRPPIDAPVHPEVARYRLLERTTYVDMPGDASAGMPAWPVEGETWVPGAQHPIANRQRLLAAVPTLIDCLTRAPSETIDALNPQEYGYEAASLIALYRLRSLVRRQPGDYDVIHAHFGPIAQAFRMARDVWDAPLIATFHGYDFSVIPRRKGSDVYTPLFRVADRVTVNCTYAGEVLASAGCPLSKLYTLRMGLDVTQFPFAERHLAAGESVRLLTVSRLVEKKGVAFALRALAEVVRCADAPRVTYDIVGDGPLRQELKSLVRELQLTDHVTFHGSADGAAVAAMMKSAHLFLLPSVTAADGDQEGTPVSLMEAQATGLPVLSTDHSGIAGVVANGRAGYLVPERDVAALADRLSQLILHPETWPAMGRAGRAHIEASFDVRALNQELVQLYQDVRDRYAFENGAQRRPGGVE